MKRALAPAAVCLALLLLGCAACTAKAQASWAYEFVRYDGGTYISSSQPAGSVGDKIGEVRYYTTDERSKDQQKDGFSNFLTAGTPLYAIRGADTSQAIAAKRPDGSYLRLEAKK